MSGWLARWRERRRRDRRPWTDAEYVVIDFETTGLDRKSSQPLSVGWVVVRDGRVDAGSAGYTPIHHDGHIPVDTVAVHGLLPTDLADAPTLEEVGERLAPLVRERLVVAHGAWMERTMLDRCGVPISTRDMVDTIHLARGLATRRGTGGRVPTGLARVATDLDLPVHRPHHAAGDALTTAGVFVALATHLAGHGARRVRDLRRLGRHL